MNRINKFGIFKRISFYLQVIIISLFLFSCNEEPTFMGSALLQDTVTIYPLSTSTNELMTGDSTFLFNINGIDKGVIHIGKANGITALSIVRFTELIDVSDTIYDFFVNYSKDKIISCKIRLYPGRYTYGDSTNPNALSFKIHEVKGAWSNKTTWDSLEMSNVIDKSKEAGSFAGSITQKEPMDSIEIDIDKDVFLDWAKKWYSTKKGDTLPVWGLAFVPDENSTVIRQFTGLISESVKASEMTIIYLDSTNNQDTLTLQKAIDKPFYKIDSFDKDGLCVQGATSLRGLLYFDVSMIPPMSAIHSSLLELTLNKDKSQAGNYPIDSTLYAELYPLNVSIDMDTTFRTYFAERNEDKYIISSITSSIEYWNRNGGKGLLVIHPEGTQNERWELDKLTFYGPDEPDTSKRPALKIIYSRVGRK